MVDSVQSSLNNDGVLTVDVDLNPRPRVGTSASELCAMVVT